MTRYAINLSLPLLLLSFLSLLLVPTVAAQETPPCEKALSVQDVVDLLEGHVRDARVALFVTSCGVDFELNAQFEQRLRSAGATSDLIQTIVRNVKLAGPKVTLKADKTEIEVGESVTLTWDSSNATELALEPDLGSVPSQGSRTVAPQKTTTYRLSARGKGGTGESSVGINVKVRPPMVSLQADKGEIARGQTVELSWESANATELTLEPGLGKIGVSGTQTVSPQRTTRYRLVARGPGGEAERTLNVSVFNPNPDYKLERTLTPHLKDVKSVAFRSDGRLLVSRSNDHTTKLWDVGTGRLLHTVPGWPVFSPDGRLLASGSEDRTVKLWDVATGGLLRSITGHYSATFNPDGSLLATWGGLIKTSSTLADFIRFSSIGKCVAPIDVIDPQSGQLLHRLTGHRGCLEGVSSVAFSPDALVLASSGVKDGINVWDSQSSRLVHTIQDKTGLALTFSPDGQLLASWGFRDTIKLWDGLTGGSHRILKGHNKWVRSVAFSPDGRLLASGSDDDTIKLWEVLTGRELRTLKGHGSAVGSVAFSPDGRLLASGSQDHTIKLWDVGTGRLLRTLEGHGDDVDSVAFSPDGRLLASGSDDDTVKLWRRVED